MALNKDFKHPFSIDKQFQKRVAYFSMEFALDQSLKTFSGGLGFLAGSHMRSAYDLKQNLIGIGVLWKYGYYDQVRQEDQSMGVLFQEKVYHFLQDTDIKFTIPINGHSVTIKVFYLHPDTFGTAPMFFLSTATPENDFLAQATTHKLYDADPSGKVAQSMVLGIGGAKLLDIIGHETEVYHLNEAHGLSAAFYLQQKYQDVEEVRKRLVFTTHTPEEAGNEKHDIHYLERLGFFSGMQMEEVRRITGIDDNVFNHTLAALRLCRKANGVSKLHGEVSRKMWGPYGNIPEIGSITNAQNKKYWVDQTLQEALDKDDDKALLARKKVLKKKLFKTVADQNGKVFDPEVLTVVWARRFAEYKRPTLLTQDLERFERLINSSETPIQFIWAGKPYPTDHKAVDLFNRLVELSKQYKNVAILTGYELELSRLMKEGADVWLNNPRVPREASGTSGMTAAMNGAINFSTNDGWIQEFARDEKNAFISPLADTSAPREEQDLFDRDHLLDILENKIVPTYYGNKKGWLKIMKTSMTEVAPAFDSDRMATEYYEKMYS